jgi:hypothetical protein
MYHTIEFAVDLWVDVEVSPRQPLEQLLLRTGSRRVAQLKPYIVEGRRGPVQVADLFFADGTTTRRVPLALFSFLE